MKLCKAWIVIFLSLILFACDSETSDTNTSTKNIINPKAAAYNVDLGVGYLRQGNYERAKQKLLLALQQDPQSSAAYSAMAYFLEKTGDYVEAERDYQKAISLAKDPGAAQNNYGTFLCRRARYSEAEQKFVQAAQDPNYLSPAKPLENAGLCALLVSDPQLATQYFQQALQKNPKMSTSMLQLGELFYKQGDYDNSYKYLTQYLKINLPTASSLWLAIRLAYQRGDYNSAASYGIILKSQFTNSQQYKAYLRLKASKG